MTGAQTYDRGWTLIELLVVIAILGLMASFAGPSVAMQIARMKGADEAHQLSSALQDARLMALRSGQAVEVSLDLEHNSLTIAGKDVLHLHEDTDLSIRAAQALMTPGRARITFWPDGTSSGAVITLKSARSLPVTLKVDWLTGVSRDT